MDKGTKAAKQIWFLEADTELKSGIQDVCQESTPGKGRRRKQDQGKKEGNQPCRPSTALALCSHNARHHGLTMCPGFTSGHLAWSLGKNCLGKRDKEPKRINFTVAERNLMEVTTGVCLMATVPVAGQESGQGLIST